MNFKSLYIYWLPHVIKFLKLSLFEILPYISKTIVHKKVQFFLIKLFWFIKTNFFISSQLFPELWRESFHFNSKKHLSKKYLTSVVYTFYTLNLYLIKLMQKIKYSSKYNLIFKKSCFKIVLDVIFNKFSVCVFSSVFFYYTNFKLNQ